MRRVPYQDSWGDEHREANRDASTVSSHRYLELSDVRTLLVFFSELPAIEQKVFIYQFCDQIYKPTEIALRLKWRSRGSAQIVQNRLKRKLSRLQPLLHGPTINPANKGEQEDVDPK